MMNQDGARLVVANQNYKRPTRSDIVYLEASPDYCLYNPGTGDERFLVCWSVVKEIRCM